MMTASAPDLRATQPKERKRFVRRLAEDHSQRLRLGVQLLFVGLTLWIGVQFYLFVRYYETGGATLYATRPPGVEGWLPIAALMNLKYFLTTGEIPKAHAAGMFLLIAFLTISLVVRKAFCGWLCPVGTLSEYLWRLGRKLFRKNWALPRWLDIPLRGLKYILLGLFGYAVASMPAPAIRLFLDGPYGVVADVKMLDFFRTLSGFGLGVTLLLVAASVFVKNFWCRYLCPYGGLMGLVALLSPLRIRRKAETCIDCAKCARACPSALPVDRLVQIRSAECLGCLECVAACPVDGCLSMAASPKVEGRSVPAWAMAAAMLAIFTGVYGFAVLTNHWHTQYPERVYYELIPKAREFTHP